MRTMSNVFSPTDSRARIADWAEIQALVVSPRKLTNSQLVRAVNIIDEPVREADDEDREFDLEADEDLEGDRGILNTVDENLSLRVFDEIDFRERTLGDSYPFSVEVTGQNWAIIEKQANADEAVRLARSFYIT